MKAWLSRLDTDLSFVPASPEEAARAELSAALPGAVCRVVTDLSMEEGYRISRETDGSYTVAGGKTGVLYGAYALVRAALSGSPLPESLASWTSLFMGADSGLTMVIILSADIIFP